MINTLMMRTEKTWQANKITQKKKYIYEQKLTTAYLHDISVNRNYIVIKMWLKADLIQMKY